MVAVRQAKKKRRKNTGGRLVDGTAYAFANLDETAARIFFTRWTPCRQKNNGSYGT